MPHDQQVNLPLPSAAPYIRAAAQQLIPMWRHCQGGRETIDGWEAAEVRHNMVFRLTVGTGVLSVEWSEVRDRRRRRLRAIGRRRHAKRRNLVDVGRRQQHTELAAVRVEQLEVAMLRHLLRRRHDAPSPGSLLRTAVHSERVTLCGPARPDMIHL